MKAKSYSTPKRQRMTTKENKRALIVRRKLEEIKELKDIEKSFEVNYE